MKVYVLVVLQNTPFPVAVEVFERKMDAIRMKEEIIRQYEGNRVYVYEREVRCNV